MLARNLLATAALVAGATAQYITQSEGSGIQYAVSIPDTTASSGSGPIFIQMVAPKGTQWLGVGQGSSMTGSNMILMYSASNQNVTISPRLGQGDQMPNFNSAGRVTLLEGSGISASGQMIANIRCDSCVSWSGGSMRLTDSGSNWVWASLSGSALDTTDTSAQLSMHDSYGTFNLDLTKATSSGTSNPFVSTSSSGSGSTSGTTSASGSGSVASSTSGMAASSTSGMTTPTSASSSSSSSSSSSYSTIKTARVGHALVMSVLFLVFFPLFALTLYLPTTKRVRYIHGPLQIVSVILLLVGLGLGVKLANSVGERAAYHEIIGYTIIFVTVLIQPAMGIYQHLHFHRTGGRSAMGVFHQWLGRSVILIGIANGGLGFLQAGPVGNPDVPRWSVMLYSIVAVVVFIIYVAVVFWKKRSDGRKESSPDQEKIGRGYSRGGYEMHPSSRQEEGNMPSSLPTQQTQRLPSRTQSGAYQTYQQQPPPPPSRGYEQRPSYR